MKLEYLLKVGGEWKRCVPCVCGNRVDNEAGHRDPK